MKLNTELVKPISRSGAVAETRDQWIEATPLQKNANVRNAMINGSLSTKLAPTILVENINPPMIGALRAKVRLKPRRTSRSEIAPENNTPRKTVINGIEPYSPALMKVKWR